MTLWGQCPKCHHALHEGIFYRPQGVQRSENCAACGWEEVVAVQEAGRGAWQRPDHTPLPDPPEGRQVGGKRHQRSKEGVVI